MKNKFSNFARRILNLTLAALILCTLSCASTDSSGKNTKNSTKSAKTTKAADLDAKLFYGTWFWDFGYDQNQFANEQLILNRDGTFELYHIQPEWFEYDNGIWSIIDDEEYGAALLLNLKNGKNRVEDELSSIDVKIYFAIHSASENELVMYRYKRDFTAMGWIIQTFNPGVFNHYFKIKDGTAKNLTGRWISNPRGITNTEPCEEIYTFYDDGTVEDMWTEGNNPPDYFKGTYEIQKEKNGNVFYNKITHVSSDNISFKEINPPIEYWYEYKMIGENLISMKFIKNNINGEEHFAEPTDNPAKVDFYYRDIPLETVTYHWGKYTFNDYYPTGEEYKTLGLEKRYLFINFPNDLLNQHLIGWCDNPELSGNLVEKIATGDGSANHEFWAKWGLKCNRNDYDPQNGKYNYNFTLPSSLLAPNMKLPSKGDKVKVVLSGKLSKDLDCWWGLDIVDTSNGWDSFGNDWHHIKSINGNFTDIFEITTTDNPKTTNFDQISYTLCYNPDGLDGSLIIDDFKFEVIDENSSTKIIEHTFNYGNFIYKKKSVSNYDYYLPSPSTFKDIPWQLYSQEFLGWYDNPDFKGNPIKVISAADNSKAKTFYGKFDIKFGAATKSDNGGFYSNSQFFVKSVIPDAKISKLNPKAGEVVKVAVSGILSKDYVGSIGVDLYNRTFNDGFLGNEWHYVETKDKKLQTYFEVKINKDANYKSIDDAIFLLALNPESEGEELILSDYKFEFVDEDPFVTTEAESKHVSIKPCAEGFEITVRKLDSEKGDWTYAEIWAEEDGHQTVAGFDLSILNKNKSITFVWPFCEKGKTYNFRFAWTDSNGKYNNQPLSVIASNGKGELNFDALKKIKVTLESNSKEANLCVANFKKENILELVKNYQESITYVGVQFPVISGLNNWSDTQWLFAVYCGLFSEIDSNNSFFAELFSKGKANLLGDYNFDWGSKEKVNEELSKKTTFWTDLRVHFNINTSPEGVSFYTISNKTDNVPYTPVKF